MPPGVQQADLSASLSSLRMAGAAEEGAHTHDGGVVGEVYGRHGHSAQPESQQVLAVMQAVLDVIRAESMPVTPTTMFAAIMSALEKPEAQAAPQVRVVCLG
jgi:ribosomal RNA-processing protein 12